MVLMSDSQYHDERRVWWKERFKRSFVRRFRAGFVAGTNHAAYLTRLGMPRDRIFLGYDVVDNEHFASGSDAARADVARVRAVLQLPDRYFLTCARFVPKKNLAVLLYAYAGYRQAAAGEPYDLVLVGDGPLRPMLTSLARELGLLPHVHMPGFMQYHELPPYYGLAAAFVLPSVQEQWGLVVNEALAAGLPVLASRVCGCVPDLLGDTPAAIFEPFDAAALADIMQRRAIVGAAADEIRQCRARVECWGLRRFSTELWSSAAYATN
jgi:glycosyltransferase involved in cell wall biosynthesis